MNKYVTALLGLGLLALMAIGWALGRPLWGNPVGMESPPVGDGRARGGA